MAALRFSHILANYSAPLSKALHSFKGSLLMKFIFSLSTLFIAAIIGGCSIASSIQRADQSESAFEDAVYEGQTTVLRNDIPDSEAYRIFHQGATGFVSVQSVRGSAERRAN